LAGPSGDLADDPGGESRPGDKAPRGTPGTAEVLCPECQGKGELMGKPCLACNGTGVVTRDPKREAPEPLG
jgi:DnaJ-class molecular chaperone